ncbi:MAG: alpha/beta fold hydrolase, partial [Candidatus Hydrogenedentes bacterium]|nr:alpha/beta fold hydrolase [Candidatus Hydrogenedentota bacterium]
SGFLEGMTPRKLGVESVDKAVLFVHGFVGAQSNFAALPDAVAEAGWYVETMRLPGHGTSPRDFERTTADELIAGVRDAVKALKQKHNTVVVVAHSMGGALSTLVAAEEPIDGLVLCAPFFGLSRSTVLGVDTGWLAHRAAPLIRWLPGRPGNGPVAKPEGRRHIQCYGWIPMAGALTALEIGNRAKDPGVLTKITAPVLVIHSKADTVTSQEATAVAVLNMTNAPVTTRWLEKSDHVIFWDYEAAIVRSRILEFLRNINAP